MNPDIKKNTTNDGTLDADYTWGRPVSTYLSAHQHLRILAVKGRLEANGALDAVHRSATGNPPRSA